ncbi:MAG: type IV pili twitching motility protein PilT [Legionellales bacterium]|jgi:twitching motility protein PilU|nr:type IV pili twitching motility protein PilT [Legionellales bacterium]MBK68926.1 type IV pili twitching motility protein PilT [Legionellales bacterium]|tara:strand:- start:1132 stop:2301 length:1170 start_codon:yes stop_codon:yes gene_type:complete
MDRDRAMKFMRDLLKALVEKDGSDLFITVGFPPAMKIHGKVTPVSKTKLTADNAKALCQSLMNDKQLKEYEATKECNFAVAPEGIGRFRANAFVQQGHSGLVLRVIETDVPNIDKLKLPEVLKDIVMTKNGLVIMVGGTGSGKSTSLAAMIDHRNDNTYGHIITIEDPIEYVHPHKKSIIMQREVGVDTDDWEIALKNTLRQAPDVILLGEIRDRETMEFAIAFAETGHLAMATLHANSANQALDRIINFFPEERKSQLLMDLSLNLKSVISQRLLKTPDGKGRVAAIEILLNSPLISDLILKGDVHEIKTIMAKSNELGMKTFDQALFDLYEADKISYEDALRSADSMNELRLRIKLEGKAAKGSDSKAGLEHISLHDDEEEEAGRVR